MWTILILHLYLEASLTLLATLASSNNLSFDPIQDSTVYNFRPPSHFEKFSHDNDDHDRDRDEAHKKDKKYRREHLQTWSLRRGGAASASASTSSSQAEDDDSSSGEPVRRPPSPPIPTPPPPQPQPIPTRPQTPSIWSQPERNDDPHHHHHHHDNYGRDFVPTKMIQENKNGGRRHRHRHHHQNEDESQEWNDQNHWAGHPHNHREDRPKPNHMLRSKPMTTVSTPPNDNGPPIGPWSESHKSYENGPPPKSGQKVTTLWNVAPHGGYVLTEETVMTPDFRSDHPGATWSTPVTHRHDKNKKQGGWSTTHNPVRTQLTVRSRTTTARTTPRPWSHRRHTEPTSTMTTWGKRWNHHHHHQGGPSKVTSTRKPSTNHHHRRNRHDRGQWTTTTTTAVPKATVMAGRSMPEKDFEEIGSSEEKEGDQNQKPWGLLGQRDTKSNGIWKRKDDPLTLKRVMTGDNEEEKDEEAEFEEDFHEEPR